ncbi:MAG: PAS domain S-box protein [Planctomycetes bacterium]|nr:PAS domain S-box protein [Planctomycetota bacterium]MBL7009233.1 PAS domain S-box protein [Planctomycetota bacterium]
MSLPLWVSYLNSFESALCDIVPEEDLQDLVRRVGRSSGRTAAGGEGLGAALAGFPELPLRPADDGFVLPAHQAACPGFVAWVKGFLEGAAPGGREVEATAHYSGGLLLRWTDEPVREDEGPGFHLAATGPLTPYQLAQVADLSADAVLFIDQDHRIRAWNRGAQEMFGYTAAEAIGCSAELLLTEDLRQSGELDELIRRTARRGRLRNYITRRRTRDGRELTVSLTRSLVRDRQGREVGAGAILRDITESEKLKHELDTARNLAALGELSAQVAHEVRNPLAGIHGALQILRRRLRPGPDEEQVFDDVAAEISRLDGLVTDLMRFGRPASPHKDRTDLAEWLENWIGQSSREADRRGAEISLDLRARPVVELDPMIFEQVLRNLLENSLEARPAGCVVTLIVEADENRAYVEFRDNGPGIPAEVREKVLQPFFTTKVRGSGLGLAICQRHLHSLGGALELLEVPSGTAVRMRLPRSR